MREREREVVCVLSYLEQLSKAVELYTPLP